MPKIPEVEMPFLRGQLDLPRATPSPVGEELIRLGNRFQAIDSMKRDVQDTIEANELLAEHTIRTRQLQDDLEQSDTESDKFLQVFQRGLDDLNQEILQKAKSDNVRNKLQGILPSRSATYINRMADVANQRFTLESVAGYERVLQANTRAYALTTNDTDRAALRAQHLSTVDELAKRYIFSPTQAQKEKDRFEHEVELFDLKRAIRIDSAIGVDAVMRPETVLTKYPHLTLQDLERVESESEQLEARQEKIAQLKRKELQDQITKTVDEAVIMGKIDFDTLGQFKDMMDEPDYRRALEGVHKNLEQGGTDDPSAKLQLETKIRLSGVATKEILNARNKGFISTKTANDLLDLKRVWDKHREGDSETDKTNPRLKGPLFQAGKAKIDRIIGKGLSGAWGTVDDATQQRWGMANDLYIERSMNEPKTPHAQIADEIIQLFQGGPKENVIPPQYRSGEKVEWERMRDDYNKADPSTKKTMQKFLNRYKAESEEW